MLPFPFKQNALDRALSLKDLPFTCLQGSEGLTDNAIESEGTFCCHMSN